MKGEDRSSHFRSMARARTKVRGLEKKRERNAKGEKGREGGRDRWKREAEAPTVIMDRPKISRFKGVRNRYVDAVEGVSCQLRTDFLDSLVLGPIVIRSGN